MKCAISAAMTSEKCRALRASAQKTCMDCDHAGNFTRSIVVEIPIGEFGLLNQMAQEVKMTVGEALADLAAFAVRGQLRVVGPRAGEAACD